MASSEQFIDEDSGYSREKNSYEEIVLKQIRETASLLSQELISSRVVKKEKVFIREDDLRVKAYNSVDTLRMLLVPFIKDSGTKDKVNEIYEEINNYLKEEGEKEKTIRGEKYKVKQLVQNSESLEFNLLWEFKLDKARELFGILVQGYQKNKAYLASFETE